MQGTSAVDLEQAGPGTHLCAFYRSRAELDRVARTFVRAALAAGDQVLYVASVREPEAVVEALEARDVEASRAMAGGQLIVQSFDDVYGRAGRLDFGELAEGFREAGRGARAEGFPGLRVAAEMGEFAKVVGSTDRLLEWERTATTLQTEEGITSVCGYDAKGFSAGEVSLIEGQHAGRSPLEAPIPLASFTVTRHPPGIRVLGEVDVSNRRTFERVLSSCADARTSVTIDVEGLAFADVGFVEVIFSQARVLPADGMIRLKNVSNQLKRLFTIVGFEDPRVVIDS